MWPFTKKSKEKADILADIATKFTKVDFNAGYAYSIIWIWTKIEGDNLFVDFECGFGFEQGLETLVISRRLAEHVDDNWISSKYYEISNRMISNYNDRLKASRDKVKNEALAKNGYLHAYSKVWTNEED